MTFQRDPLSVQFDEQARAAITRAITAATRKKRNAAVRGWFEVLVPNPPGVVPVREDRPGRLSPYERAFQRSLYYDGRVHQLTARKKPGARWSLKCDWAPVPVLPGQHRRLRITLFTDTSGARHVEKGPARESFAENPDLRSTYGRDQVGAL